MTQQAEATPFKLPQNDKVTYHRYTCAECGCDAKNTYGEPCRSAMLERRLCWSCNFWRELDEDLAKNHAKKTIIEGRIYGPGNRTSGSLRGMAGRRFDIEYVGSSVYAGQIITTFDLWSGADLPLKLRAKYPDTAKFLNGAERAQAGPITCWNASGNKTPPYKLPLALTPNATPSSAPSSDVPGAAMCGARKPTPDRADTTAPSDIRI